MRFYFFFGLCLFHGFIFCILILSIFMFFYFYVFIYLFSFYFLFQKNSSFLICSIMKIIFKKNYIFVWLNAGPLVFPKDFFNRNGTSPGPLQRLPWLPCSVCHHRYTDTTGNGQWLEKSSMHCPHRRTDTVALIYRIGNHNLERKENERIF